MTWELLTDGQADQRSISIRERPGKSFSVDDCSGLGSQAGPVPPSVVLDFLVLEVSNIRKPVGMQKWAWG